MDAVQAPQSDVAQAQGAGEIAFEIKFLDVGMPGFARHLLIGCKQRSRVLQHLHVLGHATFDLVLQLRNALVELILV